MTPPPDAGVARPALAIAVAVLLAALAAMRLGLDYPWWVELGAWLTAGPSRAAVAAQAPMVLVGTLFGVAAGVALSAAGEGAAPLQAAALFAVGAIGAARRFAG